MRKVNKIRVIVHKTTQSKGFQHGLDTFDSDPRFVSFCCCCCCFFFFCFFFCCFFLLLLFLVLFCFVLFFSDFYALHTVIFVIYVTKVTGAYISQKCSSFSTFFFQSRSMI